MTVQCGMPFQAANVGVSCLVEGIFNYLGQKGSSHGSFLALLRVLRVFSSSTCGDEFRDQEISEISNRLFRHNANYFTEFYALQEDLHGHKYPKGQYDNKEIKEIRKLLSMGPATPTSCHTSPASQATCTCSLYISLFTSCLHGLVFDSLLSHKHLSLHCSSTCPIFSHNTLYHVKHETTVNQPS